MLRTLALKGQWMNGQKNKGVNKVRNIQSNCNFEFEIITHHLNFLDLDWDIL